MSKFYITTPIYYVNAEPHTGHAYTTIAADVLARYHRLKGDDVMFLTGIDEHGENIEKIAAQNGVPPQAYCDMMAPTFSELWTKLDISHDVFLRTTSELHQTGVRKLLSALYETGDIYKDKYRGYYCRPCERFFTEKEQSQEKVCPIHKLPLEWVEEENYFFALSRYQNRLIEHIRDNPQFIQPDSRRNEMLSVLQSGLENVSISRASVSWGIPLPFDSEHISYVWIEALTNYITALDYSGDRENYCKFWPADVHLMAKDIARFHAIMWPAMLMALELPLPRQIVVHGFLTNEGEKISKTKGNVIDMPGLIDEFGLDAFRYFFMREFSFGNDGDYRKDRFILRYNADLANDLGNLLNRTLGLVVKNFESIPQPTMPGEFDDEVKQMGQETISKVDTLMGECSFDMALEELWEFVRRINRYIQQTEVWTLAKAADSRARMGTILYNSMEALRIIAVLLSPFMPSTSVRMRYQLGLGDSSDAERLHTLLSWGGLRPGQPLGEAEPIFPRIDMKKPTSTSIPDVEAPEIEVDGLVSIDDFEKLDLRVGKIISAVKVAGAERLLQLEVDIGGAKRRIVAGIAEHYEQDDLVGKQAIVLVNLRPAKIRGIESQGMVLAASSENELALATLENELPAGTRVR